MPGEFKRDDQKPERIENWKNIAHRLGTSIKTAQRYESQGLPVYRRGHTVWVLAEDLERWLSKHTVGPAGGIEPSAEPQPMPVPAPKKSFVSIGRWPTWAGVLTLIAFAWFVLLHPTPVPPLPLAHPAVPPWGRLLVKATSEGQSPTWIMLQHNADYLVVAPDGRKVYAASSWSPLLSIITPSTGEVTTLKLPRDGGPLAMSPDGTKLYVGSIKGGVMVVDPRTNRLSPTIFATPGPIYCTAITPNGSKLYLAMSRYGVWCLLTETGRMHVVSREYLPEHVAISALGERLYISYQGGPRRGYDPFGIFDAKTEHVIREVANLPMVGGHPMPSPDDRWIMLDGLDACENRAYDHRDCPALPGRVVHFLRADDLHVNTESVPLRQEPTSFIDAGKILVLGPQIIVKEIADCIETQDCTATESWESPADFPQNEFFRAVALDRVHHRAFIGVRQGQRVLSLDAEGPECAPPSDGLQDFFSGDGVMGDPIGRTQVSAAGGVRFEPGRVGQAFVFDGKSGYLRSPLAPHYRFAYRDSSVAFYVKFADVEGEATLLERASANGSFLARVTKAPDHRIRFAFRMHRAESVIVASTTSVVPNRWYHICITKDDRQIALYIDGALERKKLLNELKAEIADGGDIGVQIGASTDRQQFLNGKVDEILFYDRTLTADEAKNLYEMREPSGKCPI